MNATAVRCPRCRARTLPDREGGRWCVACGPVTEPLPAELVSLYRSEAESGREEPRFDSYFTHRDRELQADFGIIVPEWDESA